MSAYEIGAGEVRRALDAASAYWEQFGEISLEEVFEAPGEKAAEKALLAFLVSFGPLSYVRGMVESATPMPTPLEVELVDLEDELRALGEIWADLRHRRVHASRPELDKLQRIISSAGLDALREFVIEPVLAKRGMGLQAQPDTFRSLLWMEIQRHVNPKRRCQSCRKAFPQPPGRHRPFEYCDLHRTPKYRKQVQRRTAAAAPELANVAVNRRA